MILSRFVRVQLVVFTVFALVGTIVMVVVYLQAPAFAGIGRIDVTLELPSAGGLYRFGNVTYRGIEVGKVTGVELTDTGVRATLSIDDGKRIPADLEAQVRSVSAVGEQYVDLRPRVDSPPYLTEGSVIDARNTTIPQPVGPMLDHLSALIGSIPKDKMHDLLDETYAGLNGAGPDLGSLLDSASTITKAANSVSGETSTLVQDSVPLLDSQARSADAIDTWTRSLAGVTGQLVTDDPQVRSILDTGPGAANEVSRLLDTVKPTLPVLLANLTSIGQLAVTYNPSIEQLLVIFPPTVAMTEAFQASNNDSGLGLGDFRVSGISDPPPCTVGFLPPSSWRPPWDTTTIDMPNDVYCKLPQDAPEAVRGARNIPCMGKPGKRAPTAAICNSDENYVPLAPKQPVVGPYPRDPNLEAQGVPPDSRFPPPGQLPPPPTSVVPPTPAAAPAPVVPSAYDNSGGASQPSVAAAQYDPRTGRYLGPDGRLYQQSDLTAATGDHNWQAMLTH